MDSDFGAGGFLYRRSIFAVELARVLGAHGKSIDDLRRAPVTFEHQKVTALEMSLSSLQRLPALNQGDIMTIVLLLGLSSDERLQLYAGLIALGSQRLLLDYLSPQRAWEVATEVAAAALDWLRKQNKRGDDPFSRGSPRLERIPGARAGESEAYVLAIDAFDRGTELATLGEFSEDGEARREYLGQARVCLSLAIELFDELPITDQKRDDVRYWRDQALKAVTIVSDNLSEL